VDDAPLRTTILTLRSDGAGECTLSFAQHEISFGSAPHCDVRLDPGADAVHCLLAATRQGYVLEDLRSTSGTYLDERRVSQAFVEPGQTIRAGSTTIVFRLDRA
jgi:pSer/pThr/pTyr-binding forkhead associated (FHA) protein